MIGRVLMPIESRKEANSIQIPVNVIESKLNASK
jgi:hypothetical protein